MGDYEHRQYGGWWVMFVLLALGMFGLAVVLITNKQIDLGVALMLVGAGAFLLVVASMAGYLEVRDEGDRLSARFGPLPSFGTAIRYEDVESVRRAHTAMLYGFGLQGLPGLFLVLSIWGFDAVQVRMKRRRGLWLAKTVIIGTDDAENLLELLRGKTGAERD